MTQFVKANASCFGYESMKVHRIRPVVTDIALINDSVIAYVRGDFVDWVERLRLRKHE